VRVAESSAGLGEGLTAATARAYHKLLAVKDEWEVARLFVAPAFQQALARELEGPYRLHFHIGAWPFARPDPATGRMKKGEAGPWAMTAFRVMARLKFLRGTWLDPFRFSDERKLEKRLIAEFEADVADLTNRLTLSSHSAAVRVVGAYEAIRGYGHVKEASAAEAAKARMSALSELRTGKALADKAA
jgi:indolepyruvate ferredoxin oxidoreductase